jgi:uncharacterized protein
VRQALDIKPHIPVVLCDARDRRSAASVLVQLIEHVMETRAL